MAKIKGATRVPKIKNKNTSVRSRAARRAASPTDRMDLPAHASETVVEETYVPGKRAVDSAQQKSHDRPGVLTANNNGAIAKRKKQKPLSRQQRLRREKGLERAEIVMDQTETAVEKSKSRGRNVQNRRAAWKDLNEAAKQAVDRKSNKANKSRQESEMKQQDDGMTMDMDGEDVKEHTPDPAAALVWSNVTIVDEPWDTAFDDEII